MNSVGAKKRGRPNKPFHELCPVSKRRKISEISEQFSLSELGLATQKSFKTNGFQDASRLISMIIDSPESATEFLSSYVKASNLKTYTNDEALALLVDMDLSKRKYQLMYEGAKNRNYKLYPSYNMVVAAKKRCYPPDETYRITEVGFNIDLQSILDLTASRLVQTLPIFASKSDKKLRMISKWGFDGASGQSQYKQKFQKQDSGDSSIFITTTVPISVDCLCRPAHINHWKNDRASSTSLCRPVKLEFIRESTEHTIQVKREMDSQIAVLRPTIIANDSNFKIEVHHELICSMIDGKICDAVTETKSSQSCHVCGATPKQMNHLNLLAEKEKCIDNYKYGLSTLHAWLRFLDCVLHVSYNKPFEQWSTRNPKHKQQRDERKKEIQKEYRKKTGLLIDVVKQGFGTTNDGNTARRFFRDYKLSAEITGFDVHLLKRFYVILQTISCGAAIDVNQFASYARDTAEMYVKLSWWYYMPVTVHKILVHGAEIIDYAIVPIGLLSEEVQEARHKEVRRYREFHARKVSRLKTVEDLFHALLISSDPLIKTMRKSFPMKELELLDEANNLLRNSDRVLQDPILFV